LDPGAAGAGDGAGAGDEPGAVPTAAATDGQDRVADAIQERRSAAVVPPPPAPVPGANRRAVQSLPDAATARGPVKWVPHTHANPKHAKFCFICLHGRLEGQKDGVEEEVARRRGTDDEDLPSAVEMKELGYLLPGNVRFRRANADFDKNNLTATWLRDVTRHVYDETVLTMVAEQNADIIHGRDIKLVDFDEDLPDREVLERLFTMSEDERAGVRRKLAKLGSWCAAQESRILDVMPPLRERAPLPEVEPPTEEQWPGLEYKPLIDETLLKGDSAASTRQALRDADAIIGCCAKGKPFGGFSVDSLMGPQTYPDMPEVEMIAYELKREDVPAYEPLQVHKPKLVPIGAITDPFVQPFLYLPEFEERIMPDFPGTASVGHARSHPPQPAEEEWLTATRSIFADNNAEGEEYGWGLAPPRGRIMPTLIDEPYLPPISLVDSDSAGQKRIIVRSIWDPDLFTQEGRMVPPLKARGRALYQPQPFDHPEDPRWSNQLAPIRHREEKVKKLIPIIPVRSFARFRPKRVDVQIPPFLWDLVHKDASGQGLWDVIKQRHEIPAEARAEDEAREKEAEEERIRLVTLVDSQAKATTIAGVEATNVAPAGEAMVSTEEATLAAALQGGTQGTTGGAWRSRTPNLGPATDDTPLSATQASFVLQPPRPPSARCRTVAERVAGLPELEVEVPGPPSPLEVPFTQATVQSPMAPDALPEGSSDHELALREHQQRVRDLIQIGGEGRRVEEVIADERFIDTLAEKISLRLGAAGPGPRMSQTAQDSAAKGAWATQLLTGSVTLSGQPTAQIVKPEPPSFAEPTDENSRAELPRALQGLQGGDLTGKGGKGKGKAALTKEPTTVCDVNFFTQEKMRGECYVRLLIRPEEGAARKVPVPYNPDTVVPDSALVHKQGRPNMVVPPKPPVVGEDGEIIEEDEFADFEQNDTVIFSFVRHNRYDAVEALIQQDHTVLSSSDENGNTLLHVACQNNNRRIVKLLLKNHIAVNTQNEKGNTALHYCYQYHFMPLAEYLLSHGADDSIANQHGCLPSQGTGRQEEDIAGAQRSLLTQRG